MTEQPFDGMKIYVPLYFFVEDQELVKAAMDSNSPVDACSAFAMNAVYLRLEELRKEDHDKANRPDDDRVQKTFNTHQSHCRIVRRLEMAQSIPVPGRGLITPVNQSAKRHGGARVHTEASEGPAIILGPGGEFRRSIDINSMPDDTPLGAALKAAAAVSVVIIILLCIIKFAF